MSVIGCDDASVDENKHDMVAAYAAGCRFLVKRRAYGTWIDPDASEALRAAARAAGVVWGEYLFLRAPFRGAPAPEPEAQVDAFADAYKPAPGDFPPALDIEFPGRGEPDTGMTAPALLAWVLRAQRRMRSRFGVAPLDYTSQRVWHEDLGDGTAPDFADSPPWLARYPFASGQPAVLDPDAAGVVVPPVPAVFGDRDDVWLHQYQGDAIRFPGFSHTVDVNRFRLLAKGARGTRVAWVQRRLAAFFGMAVAVSDVFDVGLEQLVKAFQAALGLAVDGVIGPRTFARLAWVAVAS